MKQENVSSFCLCPGSRQGYGESETNNLTIELLHTCTCISKTNNKKTQFITNPQRPPKNKRTSNHPYLPNHIATNSLAWLHFILLSSLCSPQLLNQGNYLTSSSHTGKELLWSAMATDRPFGWMGPAFICSRPDNRRRGSQGKHEVRWLCAQKQTSFWLETYTKPHRTNVLKHAMHSELKLWQQWGSITVLVHRYIINRSR